METETKSPRESKSSEMEMENEQTTEAVDTETKALMVTDKVDSDHPIETPDGPVEKVVEEDHQKQQHEEQHEQVEEEVKREMSEEEKPPPEVKLGEEKAVDLEITVPQVESELKSRGIDLEVEAEAEADDDAEIAPLAAEKPVEDGKGKGKCTVSETSSPVSRLDDDDCMEGPSSRGFELVFRSNGDKKSFSREENLKVEPLDLSLGLPGVSSMDFPSRLEPGIPSRSFQSLPCSSFRTASNGFTNSVSFSGSQAFSHNPSCSLTQTSFDNANYEQSVASRPIFQGIDQAIAGTSNDPKQKEVGLYHMLLSNGSGHGHHHQRKVQSPTQSFGSRDTTRSEHSRDRKRVLTREESSSSLFRSGSDQRGPAGGVSSIEKIAMKITSESVLLMGKRMQDMADPALAFLKDSIAEMITNESKKGQICALQEVLRSRADLTAETLLRCHRVHLEILVALKTGLPEYLRMTSNFSSQDLVDVFLNMKCRNPACRNNLPVDECDCKVCVQKNGFCSTCMCLVCLKFDSALNTCGWVGCDVCLHWCHTDCGLRNSHIRSRQSTAGTQGITEMQFHCVACNYPSEMFGFVKEVFKTCAKDWKAETLAKELDYVRKIFAASEDVRGKKLHGIAINLLARLESKADLSEVIGYIMSFFSESDINSSNGPSTVSAKESTQRNVEGSNGIVGPSQQAMWLPSVAIQKDLRLENSGGVLPGLDWDLGKQSRGAGLQLNVEKKPVVDELESIVKFKQAEAKMFQDKADGARREAEGLKRIAAAKNEKIEEEYISKVGKLGLAEAKDRRRQKLEEFQVLEKAHQEYFNMKRRMEADIKDLLLKMESTKKNFGT
ncbi:Protein OBERON 4 [Acorus calamus]|uniref:Protein OBERON 4 n=1 Tax=Acorus calamus TaxID=4465 RepID=A0AAV9C148_ACOCL|nr:Protein OBERON 4 [Acorus calamus]